MSSATPMTPVDATSTCSAAQPIASATACAISRATARPASPVHALAQPLFTTTAAACPPDAREVLAGDDDGRGDGACWW